MQKRRRIKQLEAQNQQLQAAVQDLLVIKHDVLKIIDHQLNTPLSIIHSALSMIADGDVAKKDIPDFIGGIIPRIDEFRDIVRSIMTATHLMGSAAEINYEPVDIQTVLDSVIESLNQLAKQKDIAIDVDILTSLPRIIADKYLLNVALKNILHNAIVYSNRNDQVSISVYKKRNSIAIEIIDFGCGFSPQEAKLIGDKFFRGEHASDYHPNGSGLGVYISKQILESTQGQLYISSPGRNSGCTQIIYLQKTNSLFK